MGGVASSPDSVTFFAARVDGEQLSSHNPNPNPDPEPDPNPNPNPNPNLTLTLALTCVAEVHW